jgi:hypothetical protein
MQHILGISRFQMCFSCLEDAIIPDNQVLIMLELLAPKSEGKHKKTSLKLPKKKRTINPLNTLSEIFMISA